MNSSPDQTKMTNPPTKQVKMVKIRTNAPIRLTRGDGSEHIVKENQTVEVTEEEAKEFCDKEFQLGHKDTFGNIDPQTVKPKKLVRAVRV